jgi:hypothetical protein
MTAITVRADERADMILLMSFGALASLAAGGFSAASVLQEWRGGGTGNGFTAAGVLDLFAILPEIGVLFALTKLATALGSTQLYRSSLCLYFTFWFGDVLRLFINKNLSEVWSIVLMIPMVATILAVIAFKIWFAVAIIRVRNRVGILAGVMGAVILLNLSVSLVFRILLVIADELGPVDWADSVRSLVGVVLNALLLFLMFLSARDRLIEGLP